MKALLTVASVVVPLVMTCSCGSGGGGLVLERGGTSVSIDPVGMELLLKRSSEVLLRIPASGFSLGIVKQLDDGANYDPVPLLLPDQSYLPLDGLEFLAPVAMEVSDHQAGKIALKIAYPRNLQGQLVISAPADGRFQGEWMPTTPDAPLAFFRLGLGVDPTEGFYGLGGYFDDVNHRGKIRAMQIELDGTIESSYNEAHTPVPLLIGTRGWGVFIQCRYPGVFDVATQEPTLVEATFGTGLASGQGLTFFLLAAQKPLDILKLYFDVTGYPGLPAAWALGPWIWRDENRDQVQVEDDLNQIRDLDLADTGYWIDRPYATDVNTFDFNPPQFPDPPHMIQLLHDLGFRLALWHSPYLAENSDATKDLRTQATSSGYYPPKTGLMLNHWGRPIDFTNADAYAWWQALVHRYTDIGVEGFKLDYGEDVVVGASNQRINRWLFQDGSDERTMHGGYSSLYHRLYAETLPPSGGFLLVRHGMFGDQVHGPIVWPGDEDASFAKHREQVSSPGGDYVAVGGLPATVVYGLSLSASGFPFFGSDTGGYRHSPPSEELFIRWFEQTALSSVMQIGTSSNDVAWEFFNPANDPDGLKLGWYRLYARLHLRLWPYEWTLAQNMKKDGHPIERPLGLQHPELGVHPDDVYLFGDALLVAPVVGDGERQKRVVFPAGRWVDWWSGEVHAGGKTETVEAPLEVLPLFLREGGIVPLLRPTIDALGPTAQPDRVDSYATAPGVLYPRVAAGAATSFVLFDGTELRQEGTSSGVKLYAKAGTEFAEGVLFEVLAFGAAQPASVSDNQKALPSRSGLAELEAADSGFFYQADHGGSLFVKVPGGEHAVEIVR